MTPRSPEMAIYHLALQSDWAAAASGAGEYRMSTLGQTLDEVGFIHASYAHQVAGVAAAFYADVTEPIVLLRLDTAALPVRVERPTPNASVTSSTELFPHIYGPIPRHAVVEVVPTQRAADGVLILPDL